MSQTKAQLLQGASDQSSTFDSVITNSLTATSFSLGSSAFATTSQLNGTNTTGSITSGTTALTVASGTGISNGDFVVGQGIAPGTTVSSGGGTTSITLSATAGATLSSQPVTFYNSTKVLSPALVGGQLCRAWVNFNGTGTVAIRASYNVSSITDHGIGIYSANFTSAFADANFSAVVAANDDNVINTPVCLNGPTPLTTGAVRVNCFAANVGAGGQRDPAVVTIAVFR